MKICTAGSANFTIAEASKANVTVAAKAGKYGTIIFPFTPDVSTGFDDITFYSVKEVEKESLQLKQSMELQRQTLLMLSIMLA